VAAVRVLDCASLADGPTVGSALARLGADVIRVEPPGGDPARTTPGWADGARGCRSVTLAAGDPRGTELLVRLAEEADVLVLPSGTDDDRGTALVDALREGCPALMLVDAADDVAAVLRRLGIAIPVDVAVRQAGGLPEPGRHTEELVAEIGMTRGELEDLHADGVV
jgi:crotonobetainyl-CoA:carnitine CoA-transferase CaiB-like acyl-CoA transferase